MTVGEKLARLRREHNYTQEQLAEILQVSGHGIRIQHMTGFIEKCMYLFEILSERGKVKRNCGVCPCGI